MSLSNRAHLVIKGQANVNYIPPGCGGPLHNAVMHDAELCAGLLLYRQADPSLQSKDQACNTPLHLAAVYGDEPFTSLLLAHGADPLLRDAYGSSPFTLSIFQRCSIPLHREQFRSHRKGYPSLRSAVDGSKASCLRIQLTLTSRIAVQAWLCNFFKN